MEQWDQVGGQTTYIKPSQLKPGDTFEGVFIETAVDEKFKTLKHTLRQDDGTLKIINGTGQLNYIMAQVEKGAKIRIVFEGKKPLESGNFKGRDANQWKVLKARPLTMAPAQSKEVQDTIPF